MLSSGRDLKPNNDSPRAGERLYAELSSSKLNEESFTVALAATVVMTGKGDEKNLSKSVKAVIASKPSPNGPFCRAFAVLSAIHSSEGERAAIKDYLAQLWEEGFDIMAPDRERVRYDEDISRALTQEGIILAYCMPTELRAAVRRIGDNIAQALLSSADFRDGLELLKAGKPADFIGAREWDRKVAVLDRDMVIAIEGMRRSFVSLGFETCTNSERGDRSRVVGPTGWSISCVIRQAMIDTFHSLKSGVPTKLLERSTKLLKEFRFLDYYIKDQLVRDQMDAIKSLPRTLGDVSGAIVNRASLFLHKSLIGSLSALPPAEEATLSYFCAPPRQRVFYQTSVSGSAGEVNVDALFTHSLISVQLSDPKDSSRCCRWTIDSRGGLRTWDQLELLPFDAEDLGLTDAQFEIFRGQVNAASLAVLRELSSVWEEHPGLYGAALPSTHTIGMRRKPNGLQFDVSREDLPELLRNLGIERESEHAENGTSLAEELAVGAGGRVRVTVLDAPAPAKEAAPVVLPQETSRCPITATFVGNFCPRYADFLRELGKFGVTVESGKGSHELLRREGHHYTVSKNQRDGTLLMNRHFIRRILGALHVPESEFVARVSRRQD